MIKSEMYILPRLSQIPKIHRAWKNITERYADKINERADAGEYDSPFDAFEAELVGHIVHTTLDFGNYEGEVNGWFSDMGAVNLDGAVAEDIQYNFFSGKSIEVESEDSRSPGSYLDVEVAEMLFDLRRHYHRLMTRGRCVEANGHLHIRTIITIHPLVYSQNGDWFVTVEVDTADTGLPMSPTLDEFRTLLLYWQSRYGELVGHADSDEAEDHYATYIGRNGNKYANRLDLPSKPMGNPYSSLSGSSVRFDTDHGVESFVVDSKLTACYAYYLKSVRDLVHYGNNDDELNPRNHWVRFYNLFDRHVACHCGNFTNKKAESRFCHGLVIHGLAEPLAGVIDIADSAADITFE